MFRRRSPASLYAPWRDASYWLFRLWRNVHLLLPKAARRDCQGCFADRANSVHCPACARSATGGRRFSFLFQWRFPRPSPHSISHLGPAFCLHALLERVHDVDDGGFRLAFCDNHLRGAIFNLGLDHFPNCSGILIGHLLRLEASTLPLDQLCRKSDGLRVRCGRDALEVAFGVT